MSLRRPAEEGRSADPKRPLEVLKRAMRSRSPSGRAPTGTPATLIRRPLQLLDDAENYQARKHPEKKPAAMIAREAVQTAEDARLITLKRMDEERLAKERQDAADREPPPRLKPTPKPCAGSRPSRPSCKRSRPSCKRSRLPRKRPGIALTRKPREPLPKPIPSA